MRWPTCGAQPLGVVFSGDVPDQHGAVDGLMKALNRLLQQRGFAGPRRRNHVHHQNPFVFKSLPQTSCFAIVFLQDALTNVDDFRHEFQLRSKQNFGPGKVGREIA